MSVYLYTFSTFLRIGDFYDAARYYLHVINKWPNNRDAYLGLILCLIQLKWHREAAVWLEYYQKADPVWENHEKVVEVYNQLQSSREKWGDRTSFQDESYDIEESLKIKARDYELRFRGYISRSSEVNFLGKSLKYNVKPNLQIRFIKFRCILYLMYLKGPDYLV